MTITKSVSRIFKKIGIVLSVHAPEILIGAGAICAVSGAVIAVKETPKAMRAIDDIEIDISKLHSLKKELDESGDIEFADPNNGSISVYTKKDYTKDLIKVYTEAGLKLGKIYAPAIVTEGAAIAAMLGSHGIMRKRNAGLAASLLATEKAFKKYRDRVTEDCGEEYDRDVRLGVHRDYVEQPILKKDGTPKTDKDGNVKTEVKQVVRMDELDDHSFWFDSGSRNFNKSGNVIVNNDFAYDILKYQNYLLKEKGFVYENDIRAAFGVPLTETGATAGWLYDKRGDITGAPNDFVDVEWFDAGDLGGNCSVEEMEHFNNEHGAMIVTMKPMLSNINPYIAEVCYPREV